MSGFKSLLTGRNEKQKNCTRNESYRIQENNFPVKLIEPSIGIIVKLEITEQNEHVAKMYMNQLIKYAENLEQYGAQWTVTGGGKTIEIIFIDENMAENVRQAWKK